MDSAQPSASHCILHPATSYIPYSASLHTDYLTAPCIPPVPYIPLSLSGLKAQLRLAGSAPGTEPIIAPARSSEANGEISASFSPARRSAPRCGRPCAAPGQGPSLDKPRGQWGDPRSAPCPHPERGSAGGPVPRSGAHPCGTGARSGAAGQGSGRQSARGRYLDFRPDGGAPDGQVQQHPPGRAQLRGGRLRRWGVSELGVPRPAAAAALQAAAVFVARGAAEAACGGWGWGDKWSGPGAAGGAEPAGEPSG